MLSPGQSAPFFVGHSHDGKHVSSTTLKGKPYVLYFYRHAFTRNCTIETEGFRDNYDELRAAGYEVVGISADGFERQCSFAKQLRVTFPMIADPKCEIAAKFDVAWSTLRLISRVTYVIDGKGVILAAFRHQFQATKHLDDVWRFVRENAATRAPA